MAIRIITDSAADYSAEEIARRNIECRPMSVTFGEETYLDGVDLSKDAFFEKLLSCKDFPKTSQPSPGSFLESFTEAKEAGDEVIAILISGALSGTLQSAMIAKDMAEYDHIYIVDSLNATLGMRILVDRAVVLREMGKSAGEIVDEVNRLKSRIRLYAGLDTLEYLYKGGRISKSQASLGNLANLKPIIEITGEGMVALKGKQIGMRRVYKQLVKLVEEQRPDENYPVYFVYSYDKKNCAGFVHSLEKSGIVFSPLKIRGIGPTIGTHAGPGAFGIVYVAGEDA